MARPPKNSSDPAVQKNTATWKIEHIHEAVISTTPDLVYLFGLDHRFLYANHALLTMWGTTYEEAIGKSLEELGYETWHADMHHREIDEVIAKKVSIKGEVPFTGTGGRKYYEYIFTPVLNPDGNVTAIAGTTRDITERKEMEEALRDSEARRRLALNASEFIGTWNWNIKEDRVVADERFAELYSVDPKLAAEGTSIQAFVKNIHPEDLAHVGPVIEKVKKSGGTFSEEYRLMQPDGSARWVVARGYAHLGEDGEAVRFDGAVIDITERKLAEENLRSSERQLREITDALPQQVWTARPDGQLDYVNEQTRKYVGDIPVVDGIVQWTTVVHPDDLAGSIAVWTECMATGEFYEVTQRIRHKQSGQFRWHLSRAQPVRDSKGIILKWFGTNTDVEDQKQASEAVKEAREHLELMVESAQDYAIISMDATGRIISWSKGAERVFGYKPDAVLGEPIDIIFTPEDRKNGRPQYELSTAAEKGRANDERWHLRENGERFYVSGIMASMHDGGHRVRGFIKIARDMTREQEAQEMLMEARNAAEAANMAKTDFLANMSHEIRTPMNAIIGLSNILGMSQPLTPKQREYIKTLQMSADSMLSLVNDLLDIAKIEARTVELEQIPFNLSQIMQEVVSMMAMRVKEKGLTFTGEGECVENRMFVGDATRMRQIILNLCSNAIKFTEAGSVHVSITCRRTDTPDKETICISVKDTGIGIAPDKLDTIFQKFVQADTSISRKYGGTGLGLAITKTLAEIMGGHITVESVLGEGSTFEVCVPLEIASPDVIAASDNSISSMVEKVIEKKLKAHVLLVEDYEPNVIVATTFLEEFGYHVDVANNGSEAFDKVKNNKYAAVLMDVQMHGVNGFEATQLIRQYEKQNNLTRIPIIGMTAHALAGDRNRCIASGMDDYISKPFSPVNLEEIITKAIRKET